MNILADSVSLAIINAPIQSIDLTQWLFTLKDHEYQACSHSHIAAGATTSESGKRISINVEMIADNMLIQHYMEDISEREHCRVHSLSDSFSQLGKSKLGITWELKVKAINENACELSNRVVVLSTDDFSELLQKAGITDLTPVIISMERNASAHNQQETPLFAADIERKALTGTWEI